VVAVLAVLAVIALGALRSDDRSGLERAVGIVDDAGHFSDAAKSSASLARISSLLLDDAKRCTPGPDVTVKTCQALYSATAYTQVLAAEVVRCPPAGRQDIRVAVRAYLRALVRVTPAADPPDPPRQPRCPQS
jgi:4-hydroxy-3-methylbut-2-en-1-yl diphosphate synthase IspG/GcpE